MFQIDRQVDSVITANTSVNAAASIYSDSTTATTSAFPDTMDNITTTELISNMELLYTKNITTTKLYTFHIESTIPEKNHGNLFYPILSNK